IIGMTLLHLYGGMQNTSLVSILFTVGALFGMADILMYLRVPEPPLQKPRMENREWRMACKLRTPCPSSILHSLSSRVVLRLFVAPFRQPGYRRLILGMGLWSFSANLVLPFVPVFQRGETLGGHHLGLGVSWLFLPVLHCP